MRFPLTSQLPPIYGDAHNACHWSRPRWNYGISLFPCVSRSCLVFGPRLLAQHCKHCYGYLGIMPAVHVSALFKLLCFKCIVLIVCRTSWAHLKVLDNILNTHSPRYTHREPKAGRVWQKRTYSHHRNVILLQAAHLGTFQKTVSKN